MASDDEVQVAGGLGRSLELDRLPDLTPDGTSFWRSAAFFRRYAVARAPKVATRSSESLNPTASWEVYEGEASEALGHVRSDTFDAAVTSPPYFNARDYAQWPNLYAYLYDMQRINGEVFGTLKPGAIYAYNIFDYFDNERTVVFSDMGKKRISLSALMVDLFRRIGFRFVGALVWDKGEIHGKRGFNAGNFSPFYQAPFNCWEHVLLVQETGSTTMSKSGGLCPIG